MNKRRREKERYSQIPNPKFQNPNKFQISKIKRPKRVWNIEFCLLEFIWDLVLVIWCLSICLMFQQHKARLGFLLPYPGGIEPDEEWSNHNKSNLQGQGHPYGFQESPPSPPPEQR